MGQPRHINNWHTTLTTNTVLKSADTHPIQQQQAQQRLYTPHGMQACRPHAPATSQLPAEFKLHPGGVQFGGDRDGRLEVEHCVAPKVGDVHQVASPLHALEDSAALGAVALGSSAVDPLADGEV